MKYILLVIFLYSASLLFAQRQDTTLRYYFPVDSQASLRLDMQHTNLSIRAAEGDSIAIYSRIKLIPTNPNAPFAGVEVNSEQTSKRQVMAVVHINEDIQPHNEFESTCDITMPEGTHLTINNRFGIINLKAKAGQVIANIDYINFYADCLSSDYPHKIVANYSTIELDRVANSLTINGSNVNFKAKQVEELYANTTFSMFDMHWCRHLKMDSYTDRFSVNSIDSLFLIGEKTICQIDTLSDFLQSELNYGYLQIDRVDSGFSQLNIANTHAKTKMGIMKESHFTINADMRYCELLQENINVQEITSPSGKLYSGWYGVGDNINSNLSLISAYGDVQIDFK